MARLFGTRDERRYVIAVARLTGGRAPMLAAFDALKLVMPALHDQALRGGLEPVRLGRAVSNQAQAEAGLYLDRSFTEGACVGARCKLLAEQVELTVTRSSPALRGIVWASLALGLLLGLGTATVLMPALAGQLQFVIGLALGLAVFLGVMAIAVRIDALAGGRSAALADALDAEVRAWLAQFDADAAEPRAPA